MAGTICEALRSGACATNSNRRVVIMRRWVRAVVLVVTPAVGAKHSSAFQLTLSHFCHSKYILNTPPNDPLTPH